MTQKKECIDEISYLKRYRMILSPMIVLNLIVFILLIIITKDFLNAFIYIVPFMFFYYLGLYLGVKVKKLENEYVHKEMGLGCTAYNDARNEMREKWDNDYNKSKYL